MREFKPGDLVELNTWVTAPGLDGNVFLVLDVRKGAELDWRSGKREIHLLLALSNGSTRWILSECFRLVEEG